MKQYVILHKVDGKPALDIAHQLESDEEMWIVTTTGHRAYPADKWAITDLMLDDTTSLQDLMDISSIPDGWPEHFQQAERAVAKKGTGLNIMDFIKMPEPVIKLRRRI